MSARRFKKGSSMAEAVRVTFGRLKYDHKTMLEYARKGEDSLCAFFRGRRSAELETLGVLLYPKGRGWQARHEGSVEDFRERLKWVYDAKQRKLDRVLALIPGSRGRIAA